MALVRFCSACGDGLAAVPPVTCGSCGAEHWHNPKPCANAVVVDGGRVLLAMRAGAPWRDCWGAPGGFCDAGEHPIDTAIREVGEEVGLAVEVTGYLGTWVDEYADDAGVDGNEVINVAYYLARPIGDGALRVDPTEARVVGWFPWDALPDPLAPPGTLASVLAAARTATAAPLLDRPPATDGPS